MNIKEIAERFIKAEYEAWQNGNFDELAKIEDPNIVIHLSPLGDFKGLGVHKEYIMGASQAVSDFKMEIKYLAGDGNFFLIDVKDSGKIKADMPGFPSAIGKTLSNDFLFAVQVKKGKIIEIWANGNSRVI